VSFKGLGLRFVFGFVISIVAALIGMRFGQRFGGLFLAFPAILPASLTLIEEKEGDDPASVNATGAVLGGTALVAFAAAAAWLVPRRPPLLAVIAAAVLWFALAVAAYHAIQRRSARREVDASQGR
jgi:Protein of unknown function (DUF3147)